MSQGQDEIPCDWNSYAHNLDLWARLYNLVHVVSLTLVLPGVSSGLHKAGPVAFALNWLAQIG